MDKPAGEHVGKGVYKKSSQHFSALDRRSGGVSATSSNLSMKMFNFEHCRMGFFASI